MLRYLLISFIVAICIVNYGSVSDAQVRNIAPYLGASGSAGPGGLGWGIEAGLRFFPFYAGLEYGVYYLWPTSSSTDPIIGQIPPPFAISSVQYGGIHAGYVMSDSAFIGIVVLRNYQLWETPTSSEDGVTSTKTFLDFGLDIRFPIIHDRNIYLAFALTYRRGLKLGLDYMF